MSERLTTRPCDEQQREDGIAASEHCREDVHDWFELSYSSYLVLPRSLMQEMSPEWQHSFVSLLEQMRREFPEEASRYAVFKRGEGNRFERDPLRNYRYPDERAIAAARGGER